MNNYKSWKNYQPKNSDSHVHALHDEILNESFSISASQRPELNEQIKNTERAIRHSKKQSVTEEYFKDKLKKLREAKTNSQFHDSRR